MLDITCVINYISHIANNATEKQMTKYELAEKITSLVVEKTGSCFGIYSQKFTAKEQKQLFGQYFGKGMFIINGQDETITHSVKTAFGCDTDWTAQIKFDGTEVFNNR